MLPMVTIRKVFCIVLLAAWFTGQVGPASAESDTWTSIGPEGGTILALAIDPATPTTLYAGTGRGGVFKSTNGGGTWSPVNTGLGNFYVTGLLIDPLTPTTLYAITNGDVYKSTNGGGNWSAIGFIAWYGYQELYNLAMDPTVPTTLYSWINGIGIFKSLNSGDGWDEIVTDLHQDVDLLAVDPLTPTTLYIISDGYMLTSTNGGENWTTLSDDLRYAGNIYVFVIDPITPATMYVGTFSGVYKSTNGGLNWTKVGTIGSALALVIDPSNPTTLYAGTQLYSGIGGVFKSTNSGENWTQVNTGIDPSQTTVYSLAIDPLTPSTLYAGTIPIYGRSDGGVFKSTNGGGNWSACNTNLMNTDISALVIDPLTPTTLYAASHTLGVYKSTNSGGSWSVINNGLPFLRVITSLAIDPLTPTTLYAGTGSSGVYKSTNGGETWNEVNTGLNVIPFETYISTLVIDPAVPAIIYAGTAGGVVKSTNGGGNWNDVGLINEHVNALVIDPLTPNILYAGTFMGGVFKSTNGGGNWNPVNTGLTDDIIHTLAVDPITPGTLYAGTDMGGIFKSMDGGDHWYPVNNGLPPYPGFPDDYLTANTLAIDPTDSTTLYAGLGWGPGSITYPDLEGGVFKSTDGGGTWNAVGSGLTDFYINALAIDPAAPAELYAATDGGGIAALNNTIVVTYPLSVTLGGTGTGTVTSSPTGIDCGSACTHDFIDSTVVTLTATPTSPSTFSGWNGAGCSGTGNCIVTMSSAQSVTATFDLPGDHPPVLTYPPNGSTLQTNLPDFTWEAVNDATGYLIQISTLSNFSSKVAKATLAASVTTYTPKKDLLRNTTYYWRVAAKVGKTYGPWSETWSFTTGNPPPIPKLSAPGNKKTVAGPSPLFDWKDVKAIAGVTFGHYEIQISTYADFATIFDAGYPTDSQFNGFSLSSGTYYWRVRSIADNGDYSGWSQVRMVIIK